MIAATIEWITNRSINFVLNYHIIISQRNHCNTQNKENSDY
jgi:hypothetical protein